MNKKDAITIARGDGIGPEIMQAVLHVLEESGAHLELHEVEIGEKVYLNGQCDGIEPSTWEIIRATKAFLKAPITTPQGGGFRSLNVTIRGAMGLYANVRPCISYAPFVKTKHPHMDLVIVRENEEDLYTGIEYRHTPNVAHSLKMISRMGTEKIVRYAFEYALANDRKKVTCFTKDNIMKMSDGLFHTIFNEIAQEYPTIENEHWIVDIGAAKLADTPEVFDVIVLPNLYGDILSDVAAQISGSVGLGASANIGLQGAMFEAIHGSAPRLAGQNIANPSGLLLASTQMLAYLGQTDVANLINNAWLKTIEEGIATKDIFDEKMSREQLGTKEFTQAIIKRLGKKPEILKAVSSKKFSQQIVASKNKTQEQRTFAGVDIFIYHKEDVLSLQKQIEITHSSVFKLSQIYNRGVKVWPTLHPETSCIDEWRCRFLSNKNDPNDTVDLLKELAKNKLDIIKIEYLYLFDGKPGFSA